jgi:RNA ligase (TIGR02306 family)
MSAWYCQVVLIEAIDKHPNADSLSIATVLGAHPVIIKTGEYEVGQAVGYIGIDTVVPATAQFHFMSPVVRDADAKILGHKYEVDEVPERYRIVKAKKIRSIFSMGLLVPAPEGLSIGDSIVDVLGLTKWEESEEQDEIAHNNPKVRTRTDKKPVGWDIPFYDISSARRHSNLFLPDEEIVLLEKDHGCNASFCFDGEKLWKKSRNFFKADDVTIIDGEGMTHTVSSTDHWSEAARRYNLRDKLAPFSMKVFFAECVGQVKGFRYDSEIVDGQLLTKLHFYDVYDPIERRYLDYEEGLEMILAAGLTPSKEIYKGPWLGNDKMFPLGEGKSSWNEKHVREGWVMKPLKERHVDKVGRWQLKYVSEAYSLAK